MTHFDFLLRSALPKLIRTLGRSQLRAWCAGCSTGEEPYTLAMTLSEAMKDRPGFDFRILATDISTRVLTHARLGIYFERPIQHAVVARLSSHLLCGGYFFMGHSESLQTCVDGLKNVGASICERV